eukprot:TRINITY_DN57270_c0_g1_i1.p1 TRINITY_DN57270_c0_g1~~TRINITY_DN57270_c0_g1_i1.p1  ORF type:complete len:244 (+),score=21.14 TRINITY_DN57270_c0_g1_i1:77-733(+)
MGDALFEDNSPAPPANLAGTKRPISEISASTSTSSAARRVGSTIQSRGRGRGGGGSSRYSLRLDGGMKDVAGFETQGLRVAASCGKRLPKTQSWCFVPMIFSALSAVPEYLLEDDISTGDQIASAQEIWRALFSHWDTWLDELRKVIDRYTVSRFKADFLPRQNPGAKRWTTSLVFGEPRNFGKLPHPPGRCQDKILSLLPADTQNQIFASVMALASS